VLNGKFKANNEQMKKHLKSEDHTSLAKLKAELVNLAGELAEQASLEREYARQCETLD
jgi:hypothetical protein